MEEITIRFVDTELLETQRLMLATIEEGKPVTADQMRAIEGIQAMLDHWSDERRSY